MYKMLLITILLMFPSICNSTGWKYITRPSQNNSINKLINKLECFSPDYCIAYIGNGNTYVSSDQGLKWDSVYKFNKLPDTWFIVSKDTQYYVYYEDCNCGKPIYKKKIEMVYDNFKDVRTVLERDTAHSEVILFLPYMLNSKKGLMLSYEFKNDFSFDFDNINYYLLKTEDGWHTTSRIDPPKSFTRPGRAYYTFSNGDILFYQSGQYKYINNSDTVTRGRIASRYNFEKDQWTLLYEFPKIVNEDTTYYELGPGLIQMVNDSVGFGYRARQAAATIDSSMYFYDVFYRTRDGGKSWQKTMDTLRLSAKDDLQSFSFYDEKNGLLVGRNGKVLMTNDGGDTWYLEDPKAFSKSHLIAVMDVDWAGQFPIIGTRLDGDIYRYEGNFFKFDFKAPDLFYPKSESVGNSYNILFRWEKLRDATSYKFELSKDSEFSNILRVTDGNQMNSNYNGLEPFTEYWWRVSSTNGQESKTSAPAKFRTQMPLPQLTSPICGKKEEELKLNLTWNTVKGAEYYRIRVTKDGTLSTFDYEYEGITTTEIEIEELDDLTLYYWQV
ncbi:MAG: hypothetical protein KIT33_11460, partial [Candidatus Kapabacteria bacterium]|nr:hypothetical protein [Candidatus Kapabacteria bacterium]